MRTLGPWQWLVVVGMCVGWYPAHGVHQDDAVASAQCTKLVPMPPSVQLSESCYPLCNKMRSCIKFDLVYHGRRPYCELTYTGKRCRGRTWAPTTAPTLPPGKQRFPLPLESQLLLTEFDCPEGFSKVGGEPEMDVCVHYCKRDPLWVFGHSFMRGRIEAKVFHPMYNTALKFLAETRRPSHLCSLDQK